MIHVVVRKMSANILNIYVHDWHVNVQFTHTYCLWYCLISDRDVRHPQCPQVVCCHRGGKRNFMPHRSTLGRPTVVGQGDIPIEIICHGWELKSDHSEDKHSDTLILPLSYHDLGYGEKSQ